MKINQIVIAIFFSLLHSISIAAQYDLYWNESNPGSINHARVDGTAVLTRNTLVNNLPTPQDLSITENYIYWSERNPPQIKRADNNGNNTAVIWSDSSRIPHDIIANDQYIYLAEMNNLLRINLDGSNITTLVGDSALVNSITLHDNHIYWCNSDFRVNRSSLDNLNIETLVTGLDSNYMLTGIYVTSEFIYWTARNNASNSGRIQQANLDSSNATVLIDNIVFPRKPAVTAEYIFWTDSSTGAIQRTNLDGSGLVDIITGLSAPVGLSVVTVPDLQPPAAPVLH